MDTNTEGKNMTENKKTDDVKVYGVLAFDLHEYTPEFHEKMIGPQKVIGLFKLKQIKMIKVVLLKDYLKLKKSMEKK